MTSTVPSETPLRIANCSGFYGDRLSAAREMVDGGPVDVLTGDWLAELTMLILAGNRMKGRPGYARTFLTQMEQVLGTCLDRGVKVVSNAGGLDPAGCARAVTDLADRLGLAPTVAHVTGDDLLAADADLGDMTNMDTGEPLTATPVTANAYLGGRPIATALQAGADVVITGRVTDAALVTGPGMWRFGWTAADLDALAGSVVAGHVIECGCQATGGNYAFFEEIPGLPDCGFPIAELHADGSSVITKHPGTGGAVTIGTVTAQLLYEIASPAYPGPDVTAHFDTIHLTEDSPDRVRVTGVRGTPPPPTLKVAVNHLAGYRNTMTLVLTGLNLEAKARLAEEAVFSRVPRSAFSGVHVDLTPTTSAGLALLRLTVTSPDRHLAGRTFSSAVVETALSSYPGLYTLTPPADATPYGVYWPTTVPATAVHPRIHLSSSAAAVPEDHPELTSPPRPPQQASPAEAGQAPPPSPEPAGADVRWVPLGTIAGARSGDKGGNANLGVWTRTPDEYTWLAAYLTTDRLRRLLPETAGLRIDRHELPNLLALNFVVHGLLGRGVAASPRLDPQAKALGEQLRACLVPIPAA